VIVSGVLVLELVAILPMQVGSCGSWQLLGRSLVDVWHFIND